MSKYYGVIGYVHTEETKPGVFEEIEVERTYKGDVLNYTKRWENGEGINKNINISNQISIVADTYAYAHIGEMRYLQWMNNYWEITSITVEYPRLVLSIGGVYSGKQMETE